MKKYLLLLSILTLVLTPSTVFSSKEFNPNYIISDEELQYWQSMSATDIARFLDSKRGFISNMRAPDTDGVIQTTAKMIYDTAKKYQINPKYIIVKLQKEQSLVTEDAPTQKQLDWATGYGVCDSCSMNDPKIQKFRGFGNQVDYSAGIMRWYYDNVGSQSFIKRPGTTYTISGQQVQPANLATGFLYTYTPHVQGNQNFWKLWNSWFEQRYPNGTLIQSEDAPEVYLLSNGQRRAFKNYAALITRFDPKLIVTVPAEEISQYPLAGSISLPNYAILKQGNKYYLLDYDTLRPFASEAVVKSLGYNPAEIIEVTTHDIKEYTLGTSITAQSSSPLGEVVYSTDINSYFFVDNDVYYPIFDKRIIPINYGHLTTRNVTKTFFEGLTRGEPVNIKNGTIIGVEGFNEIFVIEDGLKRHIANEAVYNGLGYSWDSIEWISVFAGNGIPTGAPMLTAPNREALAEEATKATTFDEDKVDIVQNINTTQVGSSNTVQSITDLMVRTPASELSYIGPAFTTDLETYLVYDVDNQQIVAGKNIDYPRPPASLAKVATMYELFDQGFRANDLTSYISNKHRSTYHRFRISEGELVYNKDLLDAFIVSSLNTPGKMLVDSTAISEKQFIKDLNSLAISLNLKNTTFLDVTGESEFNVTTARDYLTMFTTAIKHTTINSYLSKRSYAYTEFTDTDGSPNHQDSHSNDLLKRTNLPYTIQASKTGYLYESGANIAMHITNKANGKKFIIIALGNSDAANRFDAPDALTRWAINTF